MTRWAMVIDLRACVGCGSCKEVCRESNDVPPQTLWRKLIERPSADPASDRTFFLTMGCMHCTNPACVNVCPTQASFCRPDGIVDIDREKCMGCAACIMACPYDARTISREDQAGPVHNRRVGSDPKNGNRPIDGIGECTKCDFCSARIDAGTAEGKTPGIDPEATPICVNFCIGGALHFGDLDNPESNVSKLVKENKTLRVNESEGTEPAVFYIPE